MSKLTDLEKVLELVINEDREQASDLLHDIFVEKSRAIYAELIEEDVAMEEDLDEAYDDSDMGDDFEDDISSIDDEIEAEESLGEDDEMDDDESLDDAEFDLADEMVGDEEGAEEMDFDSEEGGDATTDAEEALMNVEDALADLKATFAELVGDSGEEEADMDMDMDMDAEGDLEGDLEGGMEDEFDEEPLEEDAKLSDVKAPSNTAEVSQSPLAKKSKDLGKGGKPVDIAGKPEKGRKADKPKDMNVDGPQEAGELRKVKK